MNDWNKPLQNQLTSWLLRRTPAAGFRRVIPVGAAVASEIGNVRSENQDRAIIVQGFDRRGQSYVVAALADGIGGMREGAQSAALTLSSFVSEIHRVAQSNIIDTNDWLYKAVTAANYAVYDKYRTEGGSTLVATLIRSNNTSWVSAGDSRVYGSLGKKLTQLSIDDTIAGQLGKEGAEHQEQSKILQYIGMGEFFEPHIKQINAKEFDSLVLTSDGVHYLSSAPGWLGQIIGNAQEPGACVKRLVDLARWCGGPDNASVIIVPSFIEPDNAQSSEYKTLEIWDSFGELQIIAPSRSIRNRAILESLYHEQASISPSIIAPIEKNSESSNSPKEALTRENTVTEEQITQKTPKKQTTRVVGRVKKNIKKEVPQLLMDFPNKTN